MQNVKFLVMNSVMVIDLTLSESSIRNLLNARILTITVMGALKCNLGHEKYAFNDNPVKQNISSVSQQNCTKYRLQ